jgi:nitroimidazol reductase NimA-like FMN-containing flavoprotein (pyridoxamine 5'-phosphate oxidase superfamily)
MQNEKRKMNRDFAEAVIDKCGFFVMATVGPDNQPYCVPLSMTRDGEWLYFHCAQEGHKIDNLKHNNRVCISCVGDVEIPIGKFNVSYESAIIFGRAEEINSKEEKIHALRIISQRYTPDNRAAFEEAIERSLDRTGVWKIHIDEISGKK